MVAKRILICYILPVGHLGKVESVMLNFKVIVRSDQLNG